MGFCKKPNAKVIHGIVQGRGPLKGKRIGHAWVEWDESLFDSGGRTVRMAYDATVGEGGTAVPADWYRQAGKVNPKQVKEYTCKEAASLALACEHYGPWKKRDRRRFGFTGIR